MPSQLEKMRITVILALVTAVFVIVLSVWLISFPRTGPRLEVVDFKGVEVETGHAWWWGGGSCQIEFELVNTGQGNATHVHGTVEVKESAHLRAKYAPWTRGVVLTKTWSLPSNCVLKPGQTSQSVVIPLDELPPDTPIIINVECNEGVAQQFVEFP